MRTVLRSSTWPTIADRTAPRCLLVPVGATEQHGPHLPLNTDTVVAEGLAAALADRVPGAILAPAIEYGASGEHQDFPGTCSIGTEALRFLLVELVRSATQWADRVVLVNGNGGNLEAVEQAVALLREEQRDVVWVPCAVPGGDLHAGHAETSLMLHLRPADVRLELARAGNTRSLTELWPMMRRRGVRAVSANGVLGDPRGASAPEGARLLAGMVHDALTRLEDAGPARARDRLDARGTPA